jgi:hypothetical protein
MGITLVLTIQQVLTWAILAVKNWQSSHWYFFQAILFGHKAAKIRVLGRLGITFGGKISYFSLKNSTMFVLFKGDKVLQEWLTKIVESNK